ncbi:MAG TPA: sigma-70 family RNA polymerase sigma factor [Streptosporangiaceae bacterium]|nr:sigma-70 family RNA polymerase sigma factor [Streptosporangiaceae bacterium]
MRDAEMVESIQAGQAAGIAEAYDRYAQALYGYCRGLLGEPADAADAVQDTFIIAAAKMRGLRDPSRLRPWLYAVARNECRRRIRARALSVPLEEAGEVSDDTVDLGADAEQLELRALVSAALAGLNPGDREIIELNLRHELEGRDLADALGVSPNQAHALASRARSQFETSLGALLVARTGQESCPELATILSGWDGRLNVLLRKRINRHIGRCELCGARRRRELSPATLLGTLPVALLPAALRDRLFSLVSDASPAASAHRAGVIGRAGPFGQSGFPRPLDPPHLPHGPMAHVVTVGTGAAAVTIAVAGVLYGPQVLRPHGPQPPGPAAAGPSGAPGVTPSLPPGAAPGSSAAPGARGAPAAAPGSGTVPLASAPAGTSPAGIIPSSLPAASASLGVSASASPGQVAGSLAASTTVLTLQLGVTGSFTLTAQGGPVSGIRIQNPDPLDLTIALGATSLAAGQTTTVRVTMVNLLGSSSVLTVNPGGTPITVRPGLLG